jgi:hypothetical protein
MLRCTFRGGPRDGEVIDLPLPMCQARLAYESDVWYRRDLSGGVLMVQGGDRRKHPHWLRYSSDVYEKIAPGLHGRVEYQFLHSEHFTRCAALTKQGKLCRNDAEPPSDVCKTHGKNATSRV